MPFVWLYYALFAFCSGTLIWTYALYPLVLRSLKKYYRPVQKKNIFPYISIVIPTYNEEQVIAKKIENTMWLEYPKDREEIIVVDSNSTDGTVEKVVNSLGVKLIAEKQRYGKSHALNTALEQAIGEIVLITDADCFLTRKETLLLLSQNFADKSVGAVAASINFKSLKNAANTRNLTQLRQELWERQSLLDSIPTGFGEFLAFRKSLVDKLHLQCLSDDIDISMQVRTKGFRVVHENGIEAVEMTPDNFKMWYNQTVRRKLNGYTTLFHHKSMLFNHKFGWYGTMILPTSFLFHNLSPFLLMGCFITLFAINPLASLATTSIILIFAAFSSFFRRFLLIQIVDLNAWLFYALRKHKPAWEKEEHSMTPHTSGRN